MCGLGRLYSKQNVIEQLLEKEGMPSEFEHIKSMKVREKVPVDWIKDLYLFCSTHRTSKT
jgi:hypothetical protein